MVFPSSNSFIAPQHKIIRELYQSQVQCSFLVGDWISPCSPHWPGTSDLSASASRELGSTSTSARSLYVLLNCKFQLKKHKQNKVCQQASRHLSLHLYTSDACAHHPGRCPPGSGEVTQVVVSINILQIEKGLWVSGHAQDHTASRQLRGRGQSRLQPWSCGWHTHDLFHHESVPILWDNYWDLPFKMNSNPVTSWAWKCQYIPFLYSYFLCSLSD